MAPRWNSGAGAEAELPEYTGQYHLESCLGSGGMGVVHLARSASGLRLAVKVVHAELAKDREFRGRFRQEVAAARRVSGAFTAPVVDADPTAARPWMATLFIPGPTLSEYVKRNGPMSPEQLRRLMAGLAEALRDIHRVGVVHRDLKPSNVLLAEDGPKVIDFGISRPIDSELRTETGKLIGSPPFMAPEQFRTPREVGPAADIFALGAVLVHAASGRGPFDSESPYVVAYQVVHDEPDLTGVPEGMAPLVRRCLAKDPEDRPTPDELMRELRSTAASYETQPFIPAQRTGDDVRGGAFDGSVAEGTSKPGAAGAPTAARRRLPKRVALSGGVLALVLAGVCASVQWLGADGPASKAHGAGYTSPAVTPWRSEPVGKGSGSPQCAYGDGRLYCSLSDAVVALDPSSGSTLWRHTVARAGTSGPPALSGGVVQLPTDGGRRVTAFDPATGTARWQRAAPEHGGLRYAGGTLLVAAADGTVSGMDSASGGTLWQRRLPERGTPALASFAKDPLAYATGVSGDGKHTRVTAMDPRTGRVRWQARLDGMLKPVGSGGGSLVLLSADRVSGATRAVLRYTPASKATRRVRLPVPRLAPQAGLRGDAVYLLSAGGSLEAVDLDGGGLLWHLETSVSRGSAPVSDGSHVYFTAGDGRLLAVDARDGGLLGQTPPRLGSASDQVTAALPAPLLVGHRVFAAAPDGTVFAVDGRDPASW